MSSHSSAGNLQLAESADEALEPIALGDFVRAELSKAGLLEAAETILAGDHLDYRSALQLSTASTPIIAKLAELAVIRQSSDVLSHPRIRPAFFFPLAQVLEERGMPHAVAACQEHIQRLQETIVSPRTLYFAIDSWSGEFPFELLLETLAAVTREAGTDLDVVPLGPSTSELEELFERSGSQSPSEFFSPDFFSHCKEAGVVSIEGGSNADLLLLAAENNMNIAVGHDISSLCSEVIAAQRVAREQFIDELFTLRESLEATGNFSDWFPWYAANSGDAPVPLAVNVLWAIAVGRLLLPHVFFIRAPVSLLGPKLAHVALAFGANDLGFAAIDSSTADALGIVRLSETMEIVAQHDVWARVCKA